MRRYIVAGASIAITGIIAGMVMMPSTSIDDKTPVTNDVSKKPSISVSPNTINIENNVNVPEAKNDVVREIIRETVKEPTIIQNEAPEQTQPEKQIPQTIIIERIVEIPVFQETPQEDQQINNTNMAPTKIEEPVSQAKLVIFSPIRGKGLDREYIAADPMTTEANYIELGLIVFDEKGDPTNMAQVAVNATDTDQNKTINNTGNMAKYFDGTQERTVYYFPFHYEFKTSGTHTITFSTNGMTESVNLDVK